MDNLSPFFDRFSLSVRVFYSGRLCGTSGDHETEQAGHLHVLRKGAVKVTQANGRTMVVDQPSVLFYPRPYRHRFQVNTKEGAEIVCAFVEFGAGVRNPLILSLPELLVVPLSSVSELAPTAELLFAEAFAQHPGRQAAVNMLAEYFFVLLLRSAMHAQLVKSGILMGLKDPRLANAIIAIHEHPEHPWSLKELAHLAGMSRARFALHFHQTVGMTPFEYLTDWRIGVAQTMLSKGESLKLIAPSVGYASATALTRVFTQKLGLSPTEWLFKSRSAGETHGAKI
jgi:AraC-like DNA-binding protein